MNESRYILAVDQSTTGTKAILFNDKGLAVQQCYKEHVQYHPQAGWVEHDPEELHQNVKELIYKTISEAGISVSQIASIALTNQRETALIWDKVTGKPVYNAIVWQCNRAAAICNELKEKGYSERVKEITGLLLSEYFSAAKLAWIVHNVDGVKQLMQEDRLLCGTIDSWIIWKISAEKAHITDYSNASRTQLFNLKTLDWDMQLLEAFSLKPAMMPRIVSSNEIVGHMEIEGQSVRISGIMGDSHGALFAQTGFSRGVKATYGTGSSVMMNIGEKISMGDKLSTSVAFGYSGKVNYALEGNINSTGATIKWMADSMKLIPGVGEAEALATGVSGTDGVYFVPAFVGLGAPHWDSRVKALICGISFNTEKSHIVRAALESIAYQIKDVVDCIEEYSGIHIAALRVDGKPSENKFLMHFQADILGKSIIKNSIKEASAYGSALMAGLATGVWQESDIENLLKTGDTIECSMSKEQANKLYEGWKNAIKMDKSNSSIQ